MKKEGIEERTVESGLGTKRADVSVYRPWDIIGYSSDIEMSQKVKITYFNGV